MAPGEWRAATATGLVSTVGRGFGAAGWGAGSDPPRLNNFVTVDPTRASGLSDLSPVAPWSPLEPNRPPNMEPDCGCASATRALFRGAGFCSLVAAWTRLARVAGGATDAVVVSDSPGTRGGLTLGGSAGVLAVEASEKIRPPLSNWSCDLQLGEEGRVHAAVGAGLDRDGGGAAAHERGEFALVALLLLGDGRGDLVGT